MSGEDHPRLLARIRSAGPKRLLALDGGGIRGLISLEVLDRIETVLRAELGAGPDFVLADWFDYIAGTSTGAIIAAGLSIGMSVAVMRRFFLDQGPSMFGPARLYHRFRIASRARRWRMLCARLSVPAAPSAARICERCLW